MRWPVRIAAVGLSGVAAALAGNTAVLACTAFCAVADGRVLVGNNEDYHNPRTRLWFVPAEPGSYGRMYVGFDNLSPGGGMNERGLWFDIFTAPPIGPPNGPDLPRFRGNIIDAAMAECSTVDDVVRLFNRHDRSFLTEAILMFADASGDAVAIERSAIVRKTGRHFVQTNFHQSRGRVVTPDWRFTTASTLLEQAADDLSIDHFRRILAATHQKGMSPTLYSNVYDLTSRTMQLYYFHDFERSVTFNLADELKKGRRVLEIPALFPPKPAADAFAAERRVAAAVPGPEIVILAGVFVLAAFGLVVYGCIRAGRTFRLGVAAVAGIVALSLLFGVLALRMHPRTTAPWIQFSIAPASGTSAHIGPSAIRSTGITLKSALATAYDVPTVRVIGPAWLADTRYAINAVVGIDESESFRRMLQEELKRRLRLKTHFEVRPFDVFVLSAGSTPRLERARGSNTSIWVRDRDAQFKEAPMEQIASVLQGILGRPVIDETGISGSFNLDLAWGDNRVESVTTDLVERFGLRLSPARRDMEVLVVDSIQRDAALVLLAEVGRITRSAPAQVRQGIARVLTIW
jgi:uncharacterized protein (TIGR03435 family)